MTGREQQILALIRGNPLISQKSLGEQLGISREAVANHIMNLTRKGYIRGKGYLLNDVLEVVVIGGCNLDIQGIPHKAGLKGDSLPGEVTMTPGGVGRNISENLARLGHQVRLISVVGDDDAGERLLTCTAEAGVDISSVHRLNNQRSPVYLSVLDAEHELVQAINDMDQMNSLTPDVLAEQSSGLRQSQAIVVDANVSCETLEYLFSRPQLPAIFADCVSASKAEKLKPWLSHIHCLKPNRMEASLLWGKAIETQEDLESCADWFHQQGVKQIFISLGEEGLFASNGERQLNVIPTPVEVVSCSGAGDALMAGLVHSHLNQFDLLQTANFAQACASLALEHHSTINPAISAGMVQNKLRTVQ
ncbi:PfkB family carbohydrate kinase [Sansalvadorimonas sp. 2012CJ34-2]|uniref:PfkB family carbohydrate kinase n=1 Tax=Parendozoicomonas callyspongiae TaxID=2942213 RepID=A0ABT0PKK6_9GAMM|nr:PfkB family carbohydrate kinase [Sansalvadorimonas sp. 2012CJ34-2]MCL6271511.1 PfkB family carbohydrate kinase [Sansalvadorimonas sp. 2012CJ34-2]